MKKILLYIALLPLSSLLFGQQVKSPKEFLGYELGEAFTHHHRAYAYFEHVAAQSPKVKLVNYGETYEKRPLAVAFVSSAENLAKLEEIRQNNLKAAGLMEGQPSGRHLPIVWLGYNIHGNEAVGTETAIKVLHALATEAWEGAGSWLDSLVVAIDPCENPDGHNRYTSWYYQSQNAVFTPKDESWEHNEPWPGGRFNHYLFDMNRDWAWQTQAESRAKAQIIQQYMPHVFVDHHEMGMNSPFFFGPAAKPFHKDITEWQREFHRLSGENNAKYFDKEGWLYFTKEVFDLFYPSYGDTWPTYNGAIGFTFEQGGSGRGGLGVELETGDTLTLADRIAHNYTASMATVEISQKNGKKLLAEFKKFFDEGRDNPVGEYKSYVVKGSNDPQRLKAFTTLLDNQNIRYGYANTAGRARPAATGFQYLQNKDASFTLEATDIVISAHQPLSRFVKILMEPKTVLEDSLTYDLTAWALPYVYELEAYAVKERLGVSDKKVAFPFAAADIPENPYAFLAKWTDVSGVKLLAALLQKKVKVRYAAEPFTMNGTDYGRGTLVIARADNRQLGNAFAKTVVDIANNLETSVAAVSSGMAEKGKDLGSNYVRFIEKPNIALVNGPGVSPTGFGEYWFYFDQEINYPVSVISTDNLARADLSEYDVLVLPTGSYSRVESAIMEFAKNGGKVVAVERAIDIFSKDSTTGLGKATAKQKENDKDKKEGDALLKKYGNRMRESLEESVEGSIYRLTVDETHPLAFGYGNSLHVMKRNASYYPYLENGWNVGVFKAGSEVAGFTGNKLKTKLKDTFALGMERVGSGQAVYFVESPVFRGFWHSGKLLLGNALFLAD